MCYVMMNTSHIKVLSDKERSRHHEEKRRDSKGRILHTGESQRTDGKYLYKYVDAFGNTKYVYAWRLTPIGKKMTLCQLYAKQNTQRVNVKKSIQKQREQLSGNR